MTFDRGKFFDTVRRRLARLTQPQVDGFDIVLNAIDGDPLAFAAYELATCWHETNKTMQPVREAYWLSEAWRKDHLRYYPWYGRGFVQLTWEPNYSRADRELGLNGELTTTPDKAMDPLIAARILHTGMNEGWFTGVSLKKVLPSSGIATREQYMNARTIINGRDRADLVEDYAQAFERALRDGGWGQ